MNANHAPAQREFPVGAGGSAAYPEAMLARAFWTAHTHHDADTRERAEHRVARWRAVLAGMADGNLAIGSRTPVAGLPAWVTPDVIRGGFATFQLSAEGPLQPYEQELAVHAGVPAERRALFACCLTEAGLARLYAMLDSGRYEITVPEEAALLTVAWLARAQDAAGALELVETLAPFADRLRFTPRPAAQPAPAARHPGHVTARLVPALTSLRQTVSGGAPDTGEGRLLLGWSTKRHWLRPALPDLPD